MKNVGTGGGHKRYAVAPHPSSTTTPRTVVRGVGVKRVLDVALAHDADVAHDLDGRVAQHVVLLVAERLRGRDDDRVARVHAQGVKVLHVADGDAVVGRVAHDLVLELLPALHGALDEDLVG